MVTWWNSQSRGGIRSLGDSTEFLPHCTLSVNGSDGKLLSDALLIGGLVASINNQAGAAVAMKALPFFVPAP